MVVIIGLFMAVFFGSGVFGTVKTLKNGDLKLGAKIMNLIALLFSVCGLLFSLSLLLFGWGVA